MARNTITITKIKCDICGNECEPVSEVSIPVSYSYDLVTKIKFKPYVDAPYATANGDVCEKCLLEALKKYVKELEWRIKNQ